jgi:hypothetical protein
MDGRVVRPGVPRITRAGRERPPRDQVLPRAVPRERRRDADRELATNAIVHSRSGHGGTFTVRAELHPTWVWIEVEDAGGEWADPGHDDRPHGLAVVDALAREWGRSGRTHGRTVWARVDF